MKKLCLFVVLISFGFIAISQNVLWSSVHSTQGLNTGLFVETDETGNVYVGAIGEGQAVHIIKYDLDGNELMSVCSDSTSTEIYDLIVGSDGKIYWIGARYSGSGDIDAVINVINPDGSLHFSQYFDQPGYNDHFLDMEVDGAGNIYVVGNSFDSSTGIAVVIKYLPDGTPQWVQQISGMPTCWMSGRKICVDSEGSVNVACKRIYMTTPQRHLAVFRYTDQGIPLPSITVLNTQDNVINATSMFIDQNDSIYIGGYSGELSTSTSFIAKTSSEDLLWIKTLESSNGILRLYSGCLDGGDRIIFAGVNNETDANAYVRGYTSSGADLFTINFNGIGYGEERLLDIASNDNTRCLVGYCNGIGTQRDMLTLSLDGNWDIAWDATYNGFDNGYDQGNAVAADHSGNIIITGFSSTLGGTYCTTVKYSNPLRIGKPGLPGASITVFPNPAQDYLNISVSEQECPLKYKIYNTLGQTIQSGLYSGTSLDISRIEKGVLFLEVEREHRKYIFKLLRY